MKIIPSYTKRHWVAKPGISLLVIALFVAMVGYGGTCGTYNPTPSEDLEIWDWYDLDHIRDNLDGNHKLMNDLDATIAGYEELAGSTANEGKGWQPIGFYTPYGPVAYEGFRGTFDGQGYEIRDMYINRSDEYRVGLFGETEGAIIRNIGLVNVTAIGDECVGGLMGINHGTVSNCYCSGKVYANKLVGGLLGSNQDNVTNSYAISSVAGVDYVGGLLGHTRGSVINSYSISNVTGVDYVGGLVGGNRGTVSNSHSGGNVTGSDSVGGLVGWNYYYTMIDSNGIVLDSYSICSVTGYSNVGGLVGANDGTVKKSYSSGSVMGDMVVGGLVGVNRYTVSSSFWDKETSGQSTSDAGTGKNTTEMQDIATFSGAAWNITAVALNETNPTYVWNIVDGLTYPFLSWQS